MHEGRQSNVKNSWPGQPQEMMCCWQMFVLKFSTTLTMHKSSSALSMLRAAARGEQDSPEEQSLIEKLLKNAPQKASWSLSLQCQLGMAPWLPSPGPCASLTCCLPSAEKHLGFCLLSFRNQNRFSTSLPPLQG